MNRKVILFYFTLLIWLVIITGCTSSSQYNPSTSDLKLLEHHLEGKNSTHNNGNWIFIVGTMQNTGTSRIMHGGVEIRYYDKGGVFLFSEDNQFNSLDPGEIWKFKSTHILDRNNTYKINVMKGY